MIPSQKFLFYASLVDLPRQLGMFVLGGADEDNNFSCRSLLFAKYQRFVEKPPMIAKRAFFPSVFMVHD